MMIFKTTDNFKLSNISKLHSVSMTFLTHMKYLLKGAVMVSWDRKNKVSVENVNLILMVMQRKGC